MAQLRQRGGDKDNVAGLPGQHSAGRQAGGQKGPVNVGAQDGLPDRVWRIDDMAMVGIGDRRVRDDRAHPPTRPRGGEASVQRPLVGDGNLERVPPMRLEILVPVENVDSGDPKTTSQEELSQSRADAAARAGNDDVAGAFRHRVRPRPSLVGARRQSVENAPLRETTTMIAIMVEGTDTAAINDQIQS